MATTRLVLLFASCSAAVDHTYKACEVPEFEWAVYGTYTTGRMYGMASAIAGDYIFAGGFLKSTLNPEADGFVESTADYGITGPFTTIDPDGTNATTVEVDLESYPTSGGAKENAGGSWRAYEVGVAKIDITTGEPVRHPTITRDTALPPSYSHPAAAGLPPSGLPALRSPAALPLPPSGLPASGLLPPCRCRPLTCLPSGLLPPCRCRPLACLPSGLLPPCRCRPLASLPALRPPCSHPASRHPASRLKPPSG